MGDAQQGDDNEETSDTAPAITIDITRMRPVEIVLMHRYANELPVDGFPAVDRYASDFDRQLKELPKVDLPFAREVYRAFASSPLPIDRLNVGLKLRALTLADHDTGLVLWSQLVRDEHPSVRRDVFHTIHRHLMDTGRSSEAGLAEEGLTVDDAHQLRDAFIDAQYLGGCHVVSHTAIGEALQDATRGYEALARLD